MPEGRGPTKAHGRLTAMCWRAHVGRESGAKRRPAVMRRATEPRSSCSTSTSRSKVVWHRGGHKPSAIHWLVVHMSLGLVLLREAIRPHLERPRLPCESIEPV